MTETPWTCLVCNNNHYLHFTSQFRVTFKPYINSGSRVPFCHRLVAYYMQESICSEKCHKTTLEPILIVHACMVGIINGVVTTL